MSYFGTSDYYTDVALGKVANSTVVRVFGTGTVTTAYAPVTSSLVYQTPTAATNLEILSSSANDTAAGTGARTVTVIGLDTNWNELSQTVSMNGVTAVAIPTALIRLYKIVVATSGTYASMAAGSHAGTITVRVAAAGATWGSIDSTPWASGESAIACYTVPIGKTAWVLWKNANSDTTKAVDARFFQRPFANVVAAPYTGIMKGVEQEANLISESVHTPRAPIGPFVGPCDLGFIAKAATGTDTVSAEFQLLITTP